MSNLLCRLLLVPILVCSLSSSLLAANLPSRASVQSDLDNLSAQQLPETEQKAAQKALEQTLLNLDELADLQQKIIELKQQLKSAPHDIDEMQHKLVKLAANPQPSARERFAKEDLPSLEGLLTQYSAKLSAAQRELSNINSQLISAQTRPERAQIESAHYQQLSQETNRILQSNSENGQPLSRERRLELISQLAVNELRNQLIQEQLLGNNLLQDLSNNQRELVNSSIKQFEQDTLELQSLTSEKRREASENTVSEITREARMVSPDSLLAEESSRNLKYSDYLLRATDRLNFINRLDLEATQKLDTLNQSEQTLQDQIKVLKGNLLLSKILYQQKQALPSIKLDKRLGDEIADIRLYQFELNQEREPLNNLPAAVDRILDKQPPEQVTDELRNSLRQQLTTRIELLDRINRELNTLLNASISLELKQKQLLATSKALRNTLDEQMFWVPSNQPLNLAWLKLAPDYLKAELLNIPARSGLLELRRGLLSQPHFFIPLLLVIAGLLWQRKAIQQKLKDLHQDIGHFKRDSQLHTPLAILLNLLLTLPISLFFALGGLALLSDDQGQNAVMGKALLQMAQAWLLFATLYRLLSPGGVAELHFRWERRQVAFLRRQVQRLGFVVLALVMVVSIAEQEPARLARDVVGIVVVLTCFALMTWIVSQMLMAVQDQGKASLVRSLIGISFIALPIALIFTVGFGYFYTALKLTDRLIDTLYLLMLWVIIEATVVRGLSVAARRLAYQRAMSKRQNQTKEGGEGGGEIIEEPVLDIEQVNQQSLRLIRMLMFGAFFMLLYWLWADLLSAFTYLDNITLYEYTRGEGKAATLVPISVFDAIGALIVLTITVVLASNLPGLLEMLVLSRLNLAQGSAYATTTLLSYSISAIGFVATLGALGVSWDKLQWLVAALSVGLGFGLQEIFANFISGLIILFERPVRIGDTVTIGNLSGTVSRIRIRATTITDFDRKEIIVPNKTFITDQLINWSLTDTVTRLVLTIGLAYEADLAMARKLIMKILREDPHVLRDPEPQLFFMNIGASTLNYDIRFHVKELADRLPANDGVLTAIVLAFREHNIEMAFNQMDIFVKNMQGQETQLESKKLDLPAADAQNQSAPVKV